MQKFSFMKRLFTFILAALVLLTALFFAISSPEDATITSNKPQIAATLFPVFDLTHTIAGNAVDTQLILPPGASPHTFEPTPSLVRNLEDTSLVFGIGHGIDEWALALTDAPIVTLDAGISLSETHEDDHGHQGTNPHYWLTAENGEIMATTILEELSQTFPEHREEFEENHAELVLLLRALHEELERDLGALEERRIITLHDAWYYFTNAYGLTITAVFEPSPGNAPTPQYLANLTRTIRESGLQTIYTEPQIGDAGLQSFADDNSITIVQLDPIGGTDGRESFAELLRYNASQIIENN